MEKPSGTLFTISAPSGAGKTSLVEELVKKQENLRVSVSHTTRPQRPGEEDGVNYHFIKEATFHEMVNDGLFLEMAEVYGNFYGTSQTWVEQQLKQEVDVILEIDWQGAQQIRRMIPDSISIFILPPSVNTLRERLTNRGQDDEAIIAARMDKATSEISHYAESDYIVINDVFDQALEELQAIITSRHLTQKQQGLRHNQLISDLLNA